MLVVGNYDLMLRKTLISMTSWTMEIEPMWTVIGEERVKAVPAFHTFAGGDNNTGRF